MKSLITKFLTLVMMVSTMAPAFSYDPDEAEVTRLNRLERISSNRDIRKLERKRRAIDKAVALNTEKLLVLQRIAMDEGQELYLSEEVNNESSKIAIATGVSVLGLVAGGMTSHSLFIDKAVLRRAVYGTSVIAVISAVGYSVFLTWRLHQAEIGIYVRDIKDKTPEQRQELQGKLIRQIAIDSQSYADLEIEEEQIKARLR